MHTVAATLRIAQTPDEALPILLDQILTVLETDAGVIWLYHPESEELNVACARGWFSDLDEPPMKLGEGIAGRVFATGQPYLSDEFASDALTRQPRFSKVLAGWGGVCMPLRTRDETVGVLFVAVPAPRQLTANQVKLLGSLCDMGSAALRRMSLHLKTLQDAMELALAYDVTLEGWGRALELRDRETEGHTQRVTKTAILMAQAMGIGEDDLIHFRRGALLHDIGKMGIPDSILLKPGPLTEEEWAVMRRHPSFAYAILTPIEFLYPALDIPYCHHEKWDGTGYPRGLKGEEIPLSARIFAVADVYDALTSDRPYRKAWPKAKVFEHIRAGIGSHFDPAVMEAFFQVLNEA